MFIRTVTERPRIILAGLSGGSGKTIVSLGLCRAWTRSGRTILPFKKGPDYIDATWLGLAARTDATNLDPFLMSADILQGLFWERAAYGDIAVIEGNRGLFDGKDVEGSCSTAELARQLDAPVVLVMDATKMTRTAAAIVAGCKTFEPGLNLAGVICNRTAGPRHREILKQSIEHYTGVPVLGMLPKIAKDPIPERHMGLFSCHEFVRRDADAGDSAPAPASLEDHPDAILDSLADQVEAHLDMDRLLEVAASAPAKDALPPSPWPAPGPAPETSPRIGYVHDAALWFYYPENLEALRRAGAHLIPVSLLSDESWPDLDGLYLGGGFPETQAEALAQNTAVRQRVRSMVEMGLPVYAECGGFMYLGRSLIYDGREFPMSGVFPVRTELCARPQGLGYIEAAAVMDTPYFSAGDILTGHEFHYSRCIPDDSAELSLALKINRGEGMLAGHDGLVYKRAFATYVHTHALGFTTWAAAFVRACSGS